MTPEELIAHWRQKATELEIFDDEVMQRVEQAWSECYSVCAEQLQATLDSKAGFDISELPFTIRFPGGNITINKQGPGGSTDDAEG